MDWDARGMVTGYQSAESGVSETNPLIMKGLKQESGSAFSCTLGTLIWSQEEVGIVFTRPTPFGWVEGGLTVLLRVSTGQVARKWPFLWQ